MIAIVLIHNVALELEELGIAVSHVHKDGGTLDHEADVNAHEITREYMKSAGVQLEILSHPVLCSLQLVRNLIYRLLGVLGVPLVVQPELAEQCLALLIQVVHASDDLLGSGGGRFGSLLRLLAALDDLNVTRLLIILHLRGLIVKVFQVAEHAQNLHLAAHLQLQLLDLPMVV